MSRTPWSSVLDALDDSLSPDPTPEPDEGLFGWGHSPTEDRTAPDMTTLRHTVTADALLSAEEVVSLLGGRQAVVRDWLRQIASMWHPTGRRVYRWGDVLDQLRQQMREVA
jgi:hypothetical protein